MRVLFLALAIDSTLACTPAAPSLAHPVPDPSRVEAVSATSPPARAEPRAFALRTGTAYRFKGLAIDRAASRAYLASFDRRQLVVVDLVGGGHRELPTPYAGKLAALGVHLRDGRLYAVMNDIDDRAGADALSVLVVIDAATQRVLHSHELRATGPRHHFNHVAVDGHGRAYISDTLHGMIHVVDTIDPAAAIEPLVVDPRLGRVHGITLSDATPRLFATAYEGGLSIYDLPGQRFVGEPFAAAAGDDGLAYADGALYGIGGDRLTRYVLDAEQARVVRSEVIVREHESFNDPRDVWPEPGRLTCLANMELDPVAPHRRGRAATDTSLLEVPLPAR